MSVVSVCKRCTTQVFSQHTGSCKTGVSRFTFNGEERCTFCFPRHQHVYHCTQCPRGTCASERCFHISTLYRTRDREAELPVRGYCCVAQDRNPDKLCAQCLRFRVVSVSITLLGIQKYRPESPFFAFHKDVLKDVLIKQYLLPYALERDECKTKCTNYDEGQVCAELIGRVMNSGDIRNCFADVVRTPPPKFSEAVHGVAIRCNNAVEARMAL